MRLGDPDRLGGVAEGLRVLEEMRFKRLKLATSSSGLRLRSIVTDITLLSSGLRLQ